MYLLGVDVFCVAMSINDGDRMEMSKFRVYLSAIARFVVLAGILFFYTALLNSEAMSCSLANATSVNQASASKYKNLDPLTEEFSFLIQDFKMNHQSQMNNLNIKVRYCYEIGISDNEYPDFRLIVKAIQDSLENYPDEVGYWEIVNKKLTLMVLKNYPVLSNVTIEIQVSPSRLAPYLRSSIVTRHQSEGVRTGDRKNGRRNRVIEQ